MTENEQKFANYFKKAYDKGMDISQMSYEELELWLIELEDIVLTAKASIQGADLAKRERKAKLSKSELDKTLSTDSSILASDAIASVNKRKERMTKLDKLKDMYDKMVSDGTMSREDADSMLGLVKVDESKQNTMAFNAEKKDIAQKAQDAINTQKLADDLLKKASEPKEEEPPIDFSKIFG